MALAAEGATVAVNYRRDAEAAEETVATILAAGGKAQAYAASVDDYEQNAEMVAAIEADHGAVGILVNNAGIAPIANIEDTTTDVWRRVMGIHLDATFWGCQSAIALMKKSGGGSIVNMSSTAALIGLSPYLAYSAAKGGIRAMTKSIAIHCRSEGLGIRCNSVHPGSISTPMVHKALKSLMGTDLMAEEDPEKTRVALGIGEPDDVANMVLYLLSDESKHVTGAEMVIDNGDTVI